MSQYGQGGPDDEQDRDPDGQPNPFSRDGGAADGQPAPGQSGQSGQDWPGYSASAPEPTRPYEHGYSQPGPQSYPPGDIPPYGSAAPDPYTGFPPSPYESNPYAPSPYAPSPYTGGYVSPYGVVPVQHPQAVTSMVLGIVGAVACPPVGIGGLVMGGRVRREIDAEPGRYTGRGMATAGFVLGIIEVIGMALLVLLVIIGLTAGATGS